MSDGFELWGVRRQPALDEPIHAFELEDADEATLRSRARSALRRHDLDKVTVYRLSPDRRHVLSVYRRPRDGAR